jgi:protein involved in ribonucleotide reduction
MHIRAVLNACAGSRTWATMFLRSCRKARIKVCVVHDLVIGGTGKDIAAAAALLHTTLARHYWDPTGDSDDRCRRS